MLRRAHARRAGETVPIEIVALDVDAETTSIERPQPTLTTMTLAPTVIVEIAAAEIDVETVEPDVFAGVDVVALRLAANLVAVRAPTMRIRRPVERTVMPPTAETRTASPVALQLPTSRAATPAPLELVRRRPTPAKAFDEGWLSAALLHLFRASRLRSSGDLELVGVYERVPGGAIASIALDATDAVLRINPRLRPRPATLLVGRARGTDELFPVEVEPPAFDEV